MKTNQCLPAPAIFLLVLIHAACSSEPGGDQADAGPDASPETSEDGSEVTCPVERPTSLELESERDVTPDGERAHRPDVTTVGSELWLGYGTDRGGFQLQRFDTELSPIGAAIDLEDAGDAAERATDIRVGLANGQFWYAYETAVVPASDCAHNFLGAAAYSAGDPPALAVSARHIATGCPTSVEFIEHPSGVPDQPEAVDDPTPFFHDGARYILTRAWPLAPAQLHHLRRLGDDLEAVEEVLLDTDPLVPGGQLAQNALLHIEGRPFLVAGFPEGPPLPPFGSAMFAIELADDLRSFVGPAVALETPDAIHPQRVTRARHVAGTLVINYTDRYQGAPTRELLALYDVAAGFALLSQTEVQDHEVADNHSTFEVVGDRLYLFQQQDGERISAKIFRLRGQDPGP